MPLWPGFKEQLDAVCSVFTRQWCRERFVERCLVGPGAGLKWLFDKQFRGVAEWRWGTLLSVPEWLLPLKPH
eukprot:6855151-Alexandrium_andersonii.AAC.1